MKNQPRVSIIIPFYDIAHFERFKQDFKYYSKLDFLNFEIIIVSDTKIPNVFPNAKIIYTNQAHTGPAEKRDLAIKIAKGEICAFIDDDAYPDRDWLKNAVKYFKDKDIVAVGGPGITPLEDTYWEKISGLVYESFFCSGASQYRFISLPPRYVDDYPAYNLFVRTASLKKVNGYSNTFYGGEDTLLCLKLIRIGKIYYSPSVVVYHHRRKLFFGLLKQISNIGIHRGYFAKKFPQSSRKWYYFLPSFLTGGFLIYFVTSLLFNALIPFFIASVGFFIMLGAISVIDKTTLINALLVGVGIIIVHVCYGLSFINGLLITDLKR